MDYDDGNGEGGAVDEQVNGIGTDGRMMLVVEVRCIQYLENNDLQ
jgi:hypothetical protein